MCNRQWRHHGGGGVGIFPQENVLPPQVAPLNLSRFQYFYVCMCLYWLNLSFVLLFQSKTTNFRTIFLNFTQHEPIKLQNRIFKRRIFSSKGAHLAARFARIFPLCPSEIYLAPHFPQTNQVLVPPLVIVGNFTVLTLFYNKIYP